MSAEEVDEPTRAFRDRIVDALSDMPITTPVRAEAQAILDMPEMQAIRRILHGLSVCKGIETTDGRMLLDTFDLADAVRSWARGPVADMEFGFLSLPVDSCTTSEVVRDGN